jgi:hypothetical protein
VEQLDLLKKYYPEYGYAYCATMLNRTRESVKSKVLVLKLKRTNDKRAWSPEEYDILKRDYPHMETSELAVKLNRSVCSINGQAHKLNLNKTAEHRKKMDKKCGEHIRSAGVAHRFPKGHVPQNKGKKMPDEIRERVKHTWFKKGNLPKNTLYDNAITIRHDKNGHDYKYIRISKAKWVMLQVYNWEKIHGPIPKDKIIVAKDGNSLNCDPDNWMMVSRAEHLERNSGRKDLTDKYIISKLTHRNEELREVISQSPELIELKRNELKLRRTINESH